MKKLSSDNYLKHLKKNKSLVKSTKDQTVVYVFSGHPYDSYIGREDDDILLLYSLSTNDYTKVRCERLERTDMTYFLLENEEDAIADLSQHEGETYKKFLDRVKRVFG